MNPGADLTIVNALAIGVTAMAGAVTVLFWQLRATDKQQQAELEECKEDRRRLWDFVMALKKQIK